MGSDGLRWSRTDLMTSASISLAGRRNPSPCRICLRFGVSYRPLVCQRCWNYCGAGQAGEPLKTKIVSHRDHWIKVKNPKARAVAREVGAYFAPSSISARAILPALLASSQERKRTGDSIRGSTPDPSNISHVYRRGADQRCFTSIR